MMVEFVPSSSDELSMPAGGAACFPTCGLLGHAGLIAPGEGGGEDRWWFPDACWNELNCMDDGWVCAALFG